MYKSSMKISCNNLQNDRPWKPQMGLVAEDRKHNYTQLIFHWSRPVDIESLWVRSIKIKNSLKIDFKLSR